MEGREGPGADGAAELGILLDCLDEAREVGGGGRGERWLGRGELDGGGRLGVKLAEGLRG